MSIADNLKFIYHSVPFEVWVVLFWAIIFTIYIGINLLIVHFTRRDYDEDLGQGNSSDKEV